MDRFDDAELWDAYDAAVADGIDPRPAAAAIVELHMGFLRDYARRTQFAAIVFEEYVAELVAVAMTMVPRYDRSRPGHNGRLATFPTFIKPYLQEVRWKMAAAAADLPTGKETRRMIAAAQQCVAERQQLGLPDPTAEEVDEYVSARLGKRVGTARIQRALAMPTVVRGDARQGGSAVSGTNNAAPLWDQIADTAPSPEDQVLAAVAEHEMAIAVAEALAAAELTELDKALIAERLMAAPRRIFDGVEVNPGPVPYRVLAARYGLTVSEVRAAEEELKLRLRDLLADFE